MSRKSVKFAMMFLVMLVLFMGGVAAQDYSGSAPQIFISKIKYDSVSGFTEFSGSIKKDVIFFDPKVVFYVFTDNWVYSLDEFSRHRVPVKSDGTWEFTTKITDSYSRVAALLVDNQKYYEAWDTHPSLHFGVVAWTEYPEETPQERAKYFIGDRNKPAEISFTDLKFGDGSFRGTANNVDLKTTRVVLYALTNHWWVQPFEFGPITVIHPDGKWICETHGWNRAVALLVDSTYVPEWQKYLHPAFDRGVLAWTEYPSVRPDLPIKFAGYDWGIKISGDKSEPGPNYFSASTENIWVDEGGMHIKIVNKDGKWTCPEVYLLESFGYGIYTFQTRSVLSSIDPQSVFSMFLYEDLTRELDIEFSQSLANPHNAQYVVQPWNVNGNIIRFDMPEVAPTSHRIEWRKDRITYTSWKGLSSNPLPEREIFTWTYTGENIPIPGKDRVHFNLWLSNGDAPKNGIGDEVVIESFFYSLEEGPTEVLTSGPSQFALEQNFPNPFNPSTVIPYQLPREARVAIQILNMLGQKVEQMDLGKQSPGRHEVDVDASKLTSGVYFYCLQVDGNLISTRRMVLMK